MLSKDVSREQPDLYGAVIKKRYFESWYDAVTCAGFDGDELRAAGLEARRLGRIRFPKRWCSLRLKEIHASGEDLSATGLKEAEPQLYAALVRHWGSYKKSLIAHGVDPASYLRQSAWTKETITEALVQRASAGAAITPSDLRNDDSNLYSAILRHFGTLELACRAANVGGKITRRSASWQTNAGGFSKERFRECLQERRDLGVEQLTAGRVLREAPGLYHAARRHLGGWYEALATLGFKVEAIRKAGSSTRLRWTENKLLDAIKALHARGADLSVTGMKQHGHLDVYATARQRFGSWPNALRAAGLNPQNCRRPAGPRTRWNSQSVVAEIQKLFSDGADLSVTAVSQSHSSLYTVATRTYYRSWSDALMAAGIDPEAVRRGPPTWKSAKVVSELKALDEPVLTPVRIKRMNPRLYDAIHSNSAFESLEDAAEAAGVTLKRECDVPWTKERIVAEIKRLNREGAPLHSHAARHLHGKLHSAAVSKRYFGSWERAIAAAGVDYEAIKAAGNRARIESHVKWTKTSIVEAIRQRAERGQSLAPKDVNNSEKGLLQTASKARLFRSWRAAVEAAGLDYAEFVKARRRSVA